VRKAGEVVLVEGYLDAITAHQFGYTNVVATLGTALTDRHIRLLRRLTQRVTLAMDADAAGIEAALRGEEVARGAAEDGEGRTEVVVAWDALVRVQARAPVEVRVFTVPSGKDPDEAIREDPQGWPQWVAAAVPPFEFRLRHESARTDLTNPRARVELADRMLPLLLQISDPALQASYLAELARKAAVSVEELKLRLRALAPKKELGERLPARKKLLEPANGGHVPARRDDRVEAFALALLLRFPALRDGGGVLEPELFQQTELREVFEAWQKAPDALDERLPDELLSSYRDLMALRLPPFGGPEAEEALGDTVEKLRLRALTEQKRLLGAELAEVQAAVDQRSAAELAMRLQRGEAAGAGEIPDPVLAVVNHQRDDEYLMREIHALEWELRTHSTPRWLKQSAATEQPEQ
jgi:DNA primase